MPDLRWPDALHSPDSAFDKLLERASRVPRCSCGNPLAGNDRYEQMSGYCADCWVAYPTEAEEAYQAADEWYNELFERGR